MSYWTEDSNINITALAEECFECMFEERKVLLEKVLYEVWADAYTHGWSDGRADRDPNFKENPYKKPTQEKYRIGSLWEFSDGLTRRITGVEKTGYGKYYVDDSWAFIDRFDNCLWGLGNYGAIKAITEIKE